MRAKVFAVLLFGAVPQGLAGTDGGIAAQSSADAGLPTPKSLDEALEALDRLVDVKLKEGLRSGHLKPAHLHMSLGMWLRNNWGLWGGGPLAAYFNLRGIRHPDDMSSIIVESYVRRLRGQPLRVDDQVAQHLAYWRAAQRDAGVAPDEPPAPAKKAP